MRELGFMVGGLADPKHPKKSPKNHKLGSPEHPEISLQTLKDPEPSKARNNLEKPLKALI